MFNLNNNINNVILGVAIVLIGQLINVSYENSLGAVFIIAPIWTAGLILIIGGIVDGTRQTVMPKKRKRARM